MVSQAYPGDAEYNKYVKVTFGGGQCSSIIGVRWWLLLLGVKMRCSHRLEQNTYKMKKEKKSILLMNSQTPVTQLQQLDSFKLLYDLCH